MSTFRRILVAVDGSTGSRRALAAAIELARGPGGHVRMLHVLDELEYISGYEYSAPAIEDARRQARQLLDDWGRDCAAAQVPHDIRLAERPGVRLGQVVAEEAREWAADLVVVASHGRRGVGRVLLGSGAEQITRFSSLPVLVVRVPPEDR